MWLNPKTMNGVGYSAKNRKVQKSFGEMAWTQEWVKGWNQ